MRRTVDIVVASLVLAVLAPVLLVTALAVIVSSPGNPFYRGGRAGKDGRTFRMWKFRTMVPNAAQMGPPITGRDDPRITPFGQFLRKTKLDELPQFLNVLAGDMTLVGPRPEAPEIVALYTARQQAVLAVRPGVTGPAQLAYADESESIPQGAGGDKYYVNHLMAPKIKLDLEYLRTRTPLTDTRILFHTTVLVVRKFIGRPLANSHGGERALEESGAATK